MLHMIGEHPQILFLERLNLHMTGDATLSPVTQFMGRSS